jgi:signal transduction histidine kinase
VLMDGNTAKAGNAMMAAGAAGAAMVLLCALAPAELLAIKSPALKAASETGAGLGAMVGCWMAVVRAERTRALGDAAIVVAIGTITIGGMLVAVLTLVAGIGPSSIVVWAEAPGRIGAGALLVGAGLLRGARMSYRPGRVAFVAGTSIALILVGMGVAIGALGASDRLPLSLELLTAAVFLGAALALAGRARRSGDRALPCYAAFALIMGAARIAGVLAPHPGASWIDFGDLVRLGEVTLLLLAGWAEACESGRRMLQNTLEAERRRLAREVHDGLAQELAFIVSQSRRLARRAPRGGPLDLLLRASETALLDTRRTILNLSTSPSQALSTAVAQRAFVIADRAGLALELEFLDEVSVTPEIEHAILRIINEAVGNVARHAAATAVSIRVSSEGGRAVIRIVDDGKGFDPHLRRRRTAFGLAGMTERARSLGGRLRVESEPGRGTLIEVTL